MSDLLPRENLTMLAWLESQMQGGQGEGWGESFTRMAFRQVQTSACEDRGDSEESETGEEPWNSCCLLGTDAGASRAYREVQQGHRLISAFVQTETISDLFIKCRLLYLIRSFVRLFTWQTCFFFSCWGASICQEVFWEIQKWIRHGP